MHRVIWCWFFLVGSGALAVELKYESKDGAYVVSWSIDPKEIEWSWIKDPRYVFDRLEIPNSVAAGEEGGPEIPVLRAWLAVPEGAAWSTVTSATDLVGYSDVMLYPHQPLSKERDFAKPIAFNPKAYKKMQWSSSQFVMRGEMARLGSVPIMPLTIRPIQYRPRAKEIRIFLKGEIRITPDDGAPPEVLPTGTALTAFERGQLRSLVLNGDEVLLKAGGDKLLPNLLILTVPDLKAQAEALASLYVGRATVSVAVLTSGVTSAQLKTQITKSVQTNSVDSVLIFGDEKKIPLGNWSSIPGDATYSMVIGSDGIADIRLGRIPASNVEEAEIYLKKRRRYQELYGSGKKNPRVMLIAHKESYPGKYTANQEAIRKAPNPRGIDFDLQYGGLASTNAGVLERISRGYSILNYRGHGSSTAWTGWDKQGGSFGFSQIEQMNNDETNLPIFFNIACDNGAIQESTDALVEKQLFSSAAQPYEGGVAALGATQPSYTEINHKFDINLFRYIQESEDLTIGNIYALANNKLVQDAGGTVNDNVKMYLLYSDPLLPLPF